MIVINGRIFTMAGQVFEEGYVRIRGEKIVGVGEMEERPDMEGEEVLDAEGGWVLPGLIEAHCHVGITEEKDGTIGDDCNETANPLTPQLRALDGINPMDPAFHDAIRAGITGVMTGPGSANPVGGQFVFMKTQGRCVDEMAILAPAAMKAALGENPKSLYGGKDKSPATRMSIAAMIREQLFLAKQYYEKKQAGALSEPDFRMEPWIPVLERQIPLKVHAHRADDILTAIRIGKEFHLDLTLDHCTEGHLIKEQIKNSGYPAIIGPDLTARSKVEVQNMNFKTNAILQREGILIAITTDHPVSLIQSLPLCAGLAVKQGLPYLEALKAITINPARICRVSHRVGSLEPGKDADLAIYTGNPLEIATQTTHTILNGQILYTRQEEEARDA